MTAANIVNLAKPYTMQWDLPEMKVLQGFQSEAPPLPLQVFGPLTEWIAQAAEGKNAPQDYVGAALLVATASLIGNTRKVSPWEGWQEPAILNAALVGLPSSGKSPALDALLDPLRIIEKDLQGDYPRQKQDYETALEVSKNEKALWEAEIKDAVKRNEARPPKPAAACEPEAPSLARLMVNDSTIEALGVTLKQNPRGILMIRDELSGWLENMGRYSAQGGDKAFWLEVWGGRRYVFDRVKHLSNPIVVDRLSASILGGIQPDCLAKALLSGDDNGLAARFLYVWPKPIPPKRPGIRPNDGHILHAFRRMYAIPLPDEPQVMRLSEGAASLFQQFRVRLASLEEEASGFFLGHIGKLPGIALRMALVLEFLWWAGGSEIHPPGQVSTNAVTGACSLIENYFLPMARRTFGDAVLPESEKNLMALARWIYKNLPTLVNGGELRRKRVAGLTTAEAVTEALLELVDLGWLQPKPSREGQNAGRQKSDYLVNPRIWEDLASKSESP